jgi:hypothetical protein
MLLIVDGKFVLLPERIVGFTGTREGMSEFQLKEFRDRMIMLKVGGSKILHHGGCIGADLEAHIVARALGFVMHVHPSNIKHMQAKLRCGTWTVYLEEKKPLDRNKDIVKVCDILIAAPFTESEIHRSGTWATIRYARKKDKDHIIIYPSGRVEVIFSND